MVSFVPFRALRPDSKIVSKVASLPYDVMNIEEAKKMANDNPYSFLRVTRSEIELDGLENPYEEKVYKKAKENLEKMIADKALIKDESPMYYLYRQTFNGRTQTGIVGCSSIDDYMSDRIKKHEYTRPQKELDRINHFDICNANTEPVFLTYRSKDELNQIIITWTNEHIPIYDFESDDGINHELWGVDDINTIEKIKTNFSDMDALYIADGHHRTASAAKIGAKRREQYPNYTGEEAFNYFLSVVFPDDNLYIMDYNRAVKDLNGHSVESFLDALKDKFDVQEESEPFKPQRKYSFGMYLDNRWYSLVVRDNLCNDADVISRLDVSILQEHLLKPILGIEDPRSDKRIDFIGGIRGIEELELRVKNDMAVAFSMYPTTIEELLCVADKGHVMPPKSTWFEPKLRSGLFIYELE